MDQDPQLLEGLAVHILSGLTREALGLQKKEEGHIYEDEN